MLAGAVDGVELDLPECVDYPRLPVAVIGAIAEKRIDGHRLAQLDIRQGRADCPALVGSSHPVVRPRVRVPCERRGLWRREGSVGCDRAVHVFPGAVDGVEFHLPEYEDHFGDPRRGFDRVSAKGIDRDGGVILYIARVAADRPPLVPCLYCIARAELAAVEIRRRCPVEVRVRLHLAGHGSARAVDGLEDGRAGRVEGEDELDLGLARGRQLRDVPSERVNTECQVAQPLVVAEVDVVRVDTLVPASQATDVRDARAV